MWEQFAQPVTDASFIVQLFFGTPPRAKRQVGFLIRHKSHSKLWATGGVMIKAFGISYVYFWAIFV
jgi:hypothetical protein